MAHPASLSPTPPPGAGIPWSIWKSRTLTVLLVAGDTLAFAALWLAAYGVRSALAPWLGPINDPAPYLKLAPLVAVVGVANCLVFGLYLHRRRISSLTHWGSLLKAGYHYLLYLIVVAYLFKELEIGRSVILLQALFGFVYIYAARAVLRRVKEQSIDQGRGTVRTAIVGTGNLALEVRRRLEANREVGYELVGVVTHEQGGDLAPWQGVSVLGGSSALGAILVEHRIEEVFLALPHLEADEQLRLLSEAESPGIRVHMVSDLFGVLAQEANMTEIGEFPVITLRDARLPWHQEAAKRAMDLVLGCVGLVLWIVLFHWWLSLAIRRDSPGPAIFKQERIGLGGRRFQIYKYRTMHLNAPAYSVAPTNEDDPRVTRYGRWLRRTSLDELPQLLNVVRGEMSLVGPRPEMPFIVEKYEGWQRRRLDVKPGLTGLWQVIGRKNLPLHLNMHYDLYYVKNQSLLLDLEILLRTLPAVVKGRGAF